MRNAIDPTVMDALENGGRLDPERLTAAALAELHGAEALDETRREGRAIEHCRRLRVDVIQAAPDGLGGDPEALKRIADASNRYLDVLARLQRLLKEKGPMTRRAIRQRAGTAGVLGAGDHTVRSVIERGIREGALHERPEGNTTLIYPPTRLELMRSPEDLEARGTLEESARKIYDEAALIFEAVTEQEGP